MSEERKQSPHYIPELDPEKREYPPTTWGEAIYFLIPAILISISFGVAGLMESMHWLMISGFLGATVSCLLLLSMFFRKKHTVAKSEDNAEQGPHYIPELDPDNPRHKPDRSLRLLWPLICAGAALFFIGILLVANGHKEIGITLMIIGGVLAGAFLF